MRAQHFCLASVYIFFSKCNIILYCENTVSDYFFLYPSQPKYFFLKIQHHIMVGPLIVSVVSLISSSNRGREKKKNRKRDLSFP